MPTSASTEDLVLFHLSVLPEATALRTKGMAQLAAKALYISGPLTAEDLKASVEILIGEIAPGREAIVEAVASLEEDGWLVRQADGRVRLTDRATTQIANDVAASEARLDAMLDRNFPASIPRDSLRAWFKATAVEFFGRYGSEAAQAVYRGIPAGASTAFLPDLTAATAKEFGIEERQADLLAGLRAFLLDPTVQERELIFSIWQAMFAAKLIVAKAGVDPISLVQLRDSQLLLDTNVLVTAVLEGNRNYSSVSVLAKGFVALGLAAAVTPATRDEYARLVIQKKNEVRRLVRLFPRIVIEKSQDSFVQTAVERGCKIEDDYERFFESISAVPKRLDHDIIVTIVNDTEMLADFAEGTTNTYLLDDVAEIFRTQRGRAKFSAAVEHDAGLTNAVERARAREQRVLVLTADNTMCKLANRRAGVGALPAWVSIYALVELMAFDPAGPALPAADFGGLFAAMIKNDLQPVADTYTLEDLDWLSNIRAQAAELDPNAIQTIATAITRMRIRGYKRDDPRVRLVVSRLFEKSKLAVTKDRDAAIAMMNRAEEERKAEAVNRSRTQDTLLKEAAKRIRAEARLRFILWALLFFVVALVAGLIGVFLIFNSRDEVVRSIGLTLLTVGVLQVPAALIRTFVALRAQLRNADQAAIDELQSPPGVPK